MRRQERPAKVMLHGLDELAIICIDSVPARSERIRTALIHVHRQISTHISCQIVQHSPRFPFSLGLSINFRNLDARYIVCPLSSLPHNQFSVEIAGLHVLTAQNLGCPVLPSLSIQDRLIPFAAPDDRCLGYDCMV